MPTPAPHPDARVAHAGNLLVVDDDPSILDLLRECLRDDGYRVLAVATAEEALARLVAFRFDLVLSALVILIGLPAWIVLRAIRRRFHFGKQASVVPEA